VLLVSGLLGCAHRKYMPPALPISELAQVLVEGRATVQTVDGLSMTESGLGRGPDHFWVSATCHHIHVRYEANYVMNHGGVFIVSFNPVIAAAGAAVAAATVAASTEARRYQTDEPIRFTVLARRGMTYWLTSSFDGDQFHPRMAVLNAQSERVAVVLPEQPCSAQ
jgi:hypothetical protein